jgi:hypothetical protein
MIAEASNTLLNDIRDVRLGQNNVGLRSSEQNHVLAVTAAEELSHAYARGHPAIDASELEDKFATNQ